MLTLRLAWRSFLRHRRRSILTASAIALGLAMMLIFVGMGDDAHVRMVDAGVRLGSGHVVVQGKGFRDEQTLDYLVRDPDAIIAAAEKIRGVATAVPRVQASGLLTAGASSAAVTVAGVDPAREPAASNLAAERKRVGGDYLRPRAALALHNQPADIYLGERLAQKLTLELGDRVVLTMSPLSASQPTAAAYTVRGLFRTGVDELDGFYVEIPIEEARAQLALGTAVTQVALILEEVDDTARVAQALATALGPRDDLEILPWQVALRELYEAIVLDDGGLYMMMAIIFVIVTLGIFNTVTMSVVERTRELGVMMAVGTSGRRLFLLVLTEAMVLALVASAVGLAIGLSIHYWMATTGLDLYAMSDQTIQISGVALEGRVYSRLAPATVVQWTLVTIGLVLGAALYPAWRASRLTPVEAMRHV